MKEETFVIHSSTTVPNHRPRPPPCFGSIRFVEPLTPPPQQSNGAVERRGSVSLSIISIHTPLYISNDIIGQKFMMMMN